MAAKSFEVLSSKIQYISFTNWVSWATTKKHSKAIKWPFQENCAISVVCFIFKIFLSIQKTQWHGNQHFLISCLIRKMSQMHIDKRFLLSEIDQKWSNLYFSQGSEFPNRIWNCPSRFFKSSNFLSIFTNI